MFYNTGIRAIAIQVLFIKIDVWKNIDIDWPQNKGRSITRLNYYFATNYLNLALKTPLLPCKACQILD